MRYHEGDMLCAGDLPQIGTKIRLDFTKNKFYKGEHAAGQMCLVSIGMQIRRSKSTCKVFFCGPDKSALRERTDHLRNVRLLIL